MTGKEFRKWRRSEDIVQDKVAVASGIDISIISKWENDKTIITEKQYKNLMEFVNNYIQQ